MTAYVNNGLIVAAFFLTHFFIFVSIYGSISDSTTEARSTSRRPHFSCCIGVLSGQPKVQHENMSHGLRCSSHRKVGRFNISVKEAHIVDGLDPFENLIA